jgi:hypothetical protein
LWKWQAIVWTMYGVALMIPWIGTYTIASMIPNKIVIAGSAFIVSSAMRALYQARIRSSRGARLILIVVIASAAGGAVWDGVTAAVIGRSTIHQLARLGVLESGVPQLSGLFYHALVMLAWSFGYLSLSRFQNAASPESRVDRLLARDGRKSTLLGVDEIDWIEADGDYVRLHAAGKNHLIRERMVRLEGTLPPGYVRIHRSAIVNVARIREMILQPNREYTVILRDGTKLKASRTYSDRLRAMLPEKRER